MTALEFRPWPKTPRLFRDVVITEKIDGTNGAIGIVDRWGEDLADLGGEEIEERGGIIAVNGRDARVVWAQSRNRLLLPGKGNDNSGFRAWVDENARALADALGEGLHFGEWWGLGIQRGYGLASKRFSLFNARLWGDETFDHVPGLGAVPVLYEGPFDTAVVDNVLAELSVMGSQAAPGFPRPEGVVVFHTASRSVFKALLENDDAPKSTYVPYDKAAIVESINLAHTLREPRWARINRRAA